MKQSSSDSPPTTCPLTVVQRASLGVLHHQADLRRNTGHQEHIAKKTKQPTTLVTGDVHVFTHWIVTRPVQLHNVGMIDARELPQLHRVEKNYVESI